MNLPNNIGQLVEAGIEREDRAKALKELVTVLAMVGKRHGPEAVERLLSDLAAVGGQVVSDVRTFKQAASSLDKWR